MSEENNDNGTSPPPDLFGGWSPIKDAPKGRAAVMVYRADTKCIYLATRDAITNEWVHFGGSSYPVGGEITHWTTLPAPPNESETPIDHFVDANKMA